ncbi:MAG: hypothetical protein K2G88_05890 [Oscillospiraceae bacterium]|nr:hypothetical protein [Oscillospiraceae bacterium]
MNSEMLSAVLVLVALFIIITVVNVILKKFNQSYETETALISQGNNSELVQGVFIRDETVITYAGDGVISYEVADGGKLGIGSVIANVYSSENQIEMKQKITALENELYLLKRISNPGTTQTAQPASMAELFTQNYKSFLYQREQNNLTSLQESKEEMAVLLGTYQLITGDDASYQERMNKIQGEITALQQSQGTPISVISADKAAYFASYADGYEDELNLENINALSVEQLQNIENRVITDSSIVGKLIDSYQWVLVVVVDNSEKKYKTDDELILKFSSTSDTVTGIISFMNANAGEDKTIMGITCEAMTYDLVQHRVENVELVLDKYKDLQGIRVPRTALHFKPITEEITDEETGKVRQVTTEYRGVYVLDGEQPEFRKLDVIYEGEDYVISKQRPEKSYLALYDAIITKGIDADGE